MQQVRLQGMEVSLRGVLRRVFLLCLGVILVGDDLQRLKEVHSGVAMHVGSVSLQLLQYLRILLSQTKITLLSFECYYDTKFCCFEETVEGE